MKNVKIVIGASFGDEGKGLMTDYFAGEAAYTSPNGRAHTSRLMQIMNTVVNEIMEPVIRQITRSIKRLFIPRISVPSFLLMDCHVLPLNRKPV